MTIGERLRRERVRAGLTQVEIAKRLGVSAPYVCRLEHGVRRPSRDFVGRWAEVTGAGAADLVLAGPTLFDVTFLVEVPIDDPFIARRALGHLHPDLRRLVAVWPAFDGSLRLRARASALPVVVGLTGETIAGMGKLAAPTVRPVCESAELTAWLRASSEQDAIWQVEGRLALAGALGRVSVVSDGRLFVASVADLAADASLRLQELVDGSPLGLFVPALC